MNSIYEGELRGHELYHLGIKPHACEYCDKRFYTKTKLTEHIRLHTGEKPYKCDHCDYACALPGNLTKHKRNKHKI